MRWLMGVLLALVLATPSYPGEPASTVVADALDWYSVWEVGNGHALGVQTCRGELRGPIYKFRCDPLSVVVDVLVDDAGRCSIISMSRSVFPQEGLRVLTLGPPSESAPGWVQGLGVPADSGPRKRRTCGELPLSEGTFTIAVTPRSRDVSNELTIRARDAAVAYHKRAGATACVLRFPKVRTGDPFFHVYERCNGAIQAVWEFPIRYGVPAESAHWICDRRHLPRGAERRWNETDLWFETLPARR